MTSLSEHERYLDELDSRMLLKDGKIFCGFDKPFSVSLDACRSVDALVETTRMVTLRLVQQDGLDVGYLAKRFMRLADSALRLGVDIDRIYENHELTMIYDITIRENSFDHGDSYVLRFENGIGKYAGCHYLELQRALDRMSGELIGPLKVSRNMVGYSKHEQHTFVAAVDVVYSPTRLVLSLPPQCIWQFDYDQFETKNRHLNATRIALRHEFSEAQFGKIKKRLIEISTGLDFTFENFEDLDWPSCEDHGGQ